MNKLKAQAFLGAIYILCGGAAMAQELPLEYEQLDTNPSVHRHDGFYLSFALGPGYSDTNTSANPEPSGGLDSQFKGFGVGTQLLIGGTPAPGLVLGGGAMSLIVPKAALETNGEEVAKERLVLGTNGAFVDYYFDPKHGFHAQAYVGVAALDYAEGYNTNGDIALGATGALGIGNDWWVGEQWSIGVMGRLQFARTWLKVDDFPGVANTKLAYDSFAPALLANFTYH